MAEKPTPPAVPAPPPPPETQSERWAKYGANVALTAILMVALAAVLVWGVEAKFSTGARRFDLTRTSSYSLKPQTKSLLGGLKSKVKLVCLYPKVVDADSHQDFYQPMADLLDEYRQSSNMIEVEFIDQNNDKARLNAWGAEMLAKYGGDISGYQQVFSQYRPTLDSIRIIAEKENKSIEALGSSVKEVTPDQIEILNAAFNTIGAFPKRLDEIRRKINDELPELVPDYNAAREALVGNFEVFSKVCARLAKAIGSIEADEKASPALKEFAKADGPNFTQMQKLAEGLMNKAKALPPLKLDELLKLRSRSSVGADKSQTAAIAVCGEKGIKILTFGEVWKPANQEALPDPNVAHLRLAGEQRITGSILSLTDSDKKLAVFVTPQPVGLSRGLSDAVQRLQNLNFTVKDKSFGPPDERQPPSLDEPTPQELDSAVWIVVSLSPGFDPQAPNQLGAKLREHLDKGGSAMVLFTPPQGPGQTIDDLAAALSNFSVTVKTDTAIVHDRIKAGPNASDDEVEQLRREPGFFVIDAFGDHAITKPLQSLDAIFYSGIYPVVCGAAPKGVTLTPIIPIPDSPKAWGEHTEFERTFTRDADVRYDRPVGGGEGDMAPPLFGGAAIERNQTRVVVVGSFSWATDTPLLYNDPHFKNMTVARFPANGELFANSVLWLAHQDSMIALSSSALDVGRIRAMSPFALAFVRYGVLLIGLPLIAFFCGLFVFFARRD